MALKVKFRTLFPALVTAVSPITLVKTGLAYVFSFDITALRQTLDPIYLITTLTNIILSGSTSGTVTVKAPAVAGSNIVTLPAATDTLVGKATTDTLTNKTIDTAANTLLVAGVDISTAWTAYTPAVTSGSGAFTTVSATGRHKKIGKTVLLQVDVTVTTAGTAAGNLFVSLPFTAAAFAYIGSCREHALTGKSGAAVISASGTTAVMVDSTGTTFIATGNVVGLGITYETP